MNMIIFLLLCMALVTAIGQSKALEILNLILMIYIIYTITGWLLA